VKISKAEITKQLLIESALNILSKTSYKGARLSDVAKEVGLSRGAIYWNFKNKLDLYDQVFKESFDVAMVELFKILDSEGSGIEIFTKVVDYLLGKRVVIHHKSALLFNGLNLEKPDGLEEIISRVDRLFSTLMVKHNNKLNMGIESGELKACCDSRFETIALYNFLWGYFTNKTRFFSNYSSMEVRNYVIEKFIIPLKK
jgi:TetR/AcrR family acrAB operon transcriptional repressor